MEEYNKKHEHDENCECFWKDGLSIDETKMSSLIICLILSMIFAGFNYIANGDITVNLTGIIQALIYAIAGVNLSNSIINGINGIGRTTQGVSNTTSPASPTQSMATKPKTIPSVSASTTSNINDSQD